MWSRGHLGAEIGATQGPRIARELVEQPGVDKKRRSPSLDVERGLVLRVSRAPALGQRDL